MATGALFFAGCGANEPNTIYFDLSSASACAGDIAMIVRRLDVLSFPVLSSVLFVGGWMLSCAGVIVMLRGAATSQQA